MVKESHEQGGCLLINEIGMSTFVEFMKTLLPDGVVQNESLGGHRWKNVGAKPANSNDTPNSLARWRMRHIGDTRG